MMTDEEIRDAFDTNMDLTVGELARMAGRTVREIKAALMPGVPLSK